MKPIPSSFNKKAAARYWKMQLGMKIKFLLVAAFLIDKAEELPISQLDSTSRETAKYDISDGPAAKCQDIYVKDKNTPSGYYDIYVDGKVSKVYCYFHNPQGTVIRQLYSLDGRPQEWNVHVLNGLDDGDPEGAMEMQYEPGDIPHGAGPHFTQPIIDHQETMYYNKTWTIQKLIDRNNKMEREKKKQSKNP